MTKTAEEVDLWGQEIHSWAAKKDLKALTKSTHEGLGELEAHVRRLLGPGADSLDSLSYPGKAATLATWLDSINEGCVPDALGSMTLKQAQLRVGGLIHYFWCVFRLQNELIFLDAAASAVLKTDPEVEHVAAKAMRELGLESIAKHFDEAAKLKTSFAATQLRLIVPFLLAGLQTAVRLLASTDPRDVIRGRRGILQSRSAAQAAKYARGIQAATDAVFATKMTERECWDCLVDCDGQEFDAGRSSYRIVIDGHDMVYEVNLTTEHERTLSRKSFHPYFSRAREHHQKRP